MHKNFAKISAGFDSCVPSDVYQLFEKSYTQLVSLGVPFLNPRSMYCLGIKETDGGAPGYCLVILACSLFRHAFLFCRGKIGNVTNISAYGFESLGNYLTFPF